MLGNSPAHCRANAFAQSLSVSSVGPVQVRVKQHALDAAKEADTAAEDALQAKGADIEAVNAEVEQIQEDIAGAEQNIRVCYRVLNKPAGSCVQPEWVSLPAFGRIAQVWPIRP